MSPLPKDFHIARKPKLNGLPPSNDKVWTDLNTEIGNALSAVLPDLEIGNQTPEKSLQKLNEFTYKFLAEKYPPELIMPKARERRGVRSRLLNKMDRLRAQKRINRRAMRALVRAGLTVSKEMDDLRRRWRQLMRDHNRLRMRIERSRRNFAEGLFRKNPMKYSKGIFAKPKNSGKPAFSKEIAQKYFTETYGDENRGHQFDPTEGMIRPPPPDHVLKDGLTWGIFKARVRKKRNGASAGLNGLNYVVYKKLPAVTWKLFLICVEVKRRRKPPPQWSAAFMVMLAKEEDVSRPELFRNIALTNCDGKLFMTTVAADIETFAVANKFIDKSIQKGFLTGVAGCIEHTFATNEAMRDAYENHRQIILIFIDLANAYGSVMHNLIQFALWWYHVPSSVADIIFEYYENLVAQVVTEDWKTDFFRYLIGLFQGCVLSTILFDLVFNLLLDFLARHDPYGYKFKHSDLQSLRKAYADDLTLIAKRVDQAQTVLADLVEWLSWAVTMKAKPSKCRVIAAKFFNEKERERWKPFRNTTYSLFDPRLEIDGIRVKAIGDPDDPKKERDFPFLGRRLFYDRDEKPLRTSVIEDFEASMAKVDKDPINGLQKAFVYQHQVAQKLTWPFLIYDLPLAVAVELKRISTRYLKKWVGLSRSGDSNTLYRSREQFGLQLVDPTSLLKKSRLTKCHIVRHSEDPVLRESYALRSKRYETSARIWRATNELKTIEEQADFENKFKTAPWHTYASGQGLGSGQRRKRKHANLSKGERREHVKDVLNRRSGNDARVHAAGLAQQGGWTVWGDKCIPHALSWDRLIHTRSPKLIKFMLNSYINAVRCPDLMKLWGYWQYDYCQLCRKEKCSLVHVLTCCKHSLHQKRYTWRHDSVLNSIHPKLQEVIDKRNAQPMHLVTQTAQPFVASGEPPKKQAKACKPHLLSRSNDWKLLVDYDEKPIVFPPTILSTSLRPDVIIWSEAKKTVIWAELTCPAEENISQARVRKNRRYNALASDVRASGWALHDFTIEAGARGCVGKSFPYFLKKLGLTPQECRLTIKEVAHVVIRASFHIYQASKNPSWMRHELLAGCFGRAGDPSPE